MGKSRSRARGAEKENWARTNCLLPPKSTKKGLFRRMRNAFTLSSTCIKVFKGSAQLTSCDLFLLMG